MALNTKFLTLPGTPELKNIATKVQVFRVRLGMPERPALPLPDKPSIAVLAFTNMSGDVEQEYFSDGIAEDIITKLSNVRWLFVIARSSSFTFKGRATDIKQVGRQLGVQYVLDGSVRRSAERLRITAQLVEAVSGAQAWAERFDRQVEDIFAMQDEITDAVVTAIEPTMAEAERQRVGRKAPEDLNAWGLYHRGLFHFFKLTAVDTQLSLDFLNKAAALDSTNAAVHAGIALVYLIPKWIFEPANMVEWVALGLKHGRTAVNLDPLNATAHILYGLALNNSGDNELALKESARAVALNSSDAIAQGLRGAILAYSGRAAEALPHLAQAIRLSPVDPLRWLWLFHTSMAHYFLHDYEACAASGRELCRILPDAFIGYRVLLTALAELDHYDEAHHCADLIYARFPDEMTALLSTRWPQWRESDYSAHVASIAKGGLVMRNGKLSRIDRR